MASAAAIGISVYVAYKNKLLCELDPTTENQFKGTLSNYQEAIEKSRDILQRVKDEKGIPGLVVGVSIDGNTVWEEGFGFADVENRVLCSPNTVMRIASISKSITMAAVAKLWEQGKLDLNKPVQDYVPTFPQKHFNGKPVTITCRQLVSHLGGIRHYEKNGITKKNEKNNKKENEKDEFELKEYLSTVKHPDVMSALDMFKDDPLIENPGDKFLYTTHGWTLVSAVVEAASKEPFTTHITKLFKSLGMKYTYLDENDVLIYNRSRNYMRSKKGTLINSPYVDNSYKWAGGGFLSTVGDLLQFGNAMLYSFQYRPNTLKPMDKNTAAKDGKQKVADSNNAFDKNYSKNQLPGFLNNKTIEAMWQPIAPTYGMGWFVKAQKQECQFCESNEFCVYHTGAAIGASSVLLILPKNISKDEYLKPELLPKGIAVTIICNMQSVGLAQTALRIAKEFDGADL
ncbi:hypothetical protein JTE90_001569 [Oedothorax gibbosus]|uniref:Beta-lactamase-related domain-containing protein n=1 Tax=Oedothorax gibbosus TaxID=931172 RepID=A0AAV6VLX0_9ARAC|nr:hypothetical protein JTE90_001569 [Oedothorax gibbosus]